MTYETERVRLDPQVLRSDVTAVVEGREPGAYWVLEEEGRVRAQLLLTYEWSDWRNRTVWWIQSVWVDPDDRTVYVLLSNRLHPGGRTPDLHPLRRRFHALARGSLSAGRPLDSIGEP